MQIDVSCKKILTLFIFLVVYFLLFPKVAAAYGIPGWGWGKVTYSTGSENTLIYTTRDAQTGNLISTDELHIFLASSGPGGFPPYARYDCWSNCPSIVTLTGIPSNVFVGHYGLSKKAGYSDAVNPGNFGLWPPNAYTGTMVITLDTYLTSVGIPPRVEQISPAPIWYDHFPPIVWRIYPSSWTGATRVDCVRLGPNCSGPYFGLFPQDVTVAPISGWTDGWIGYSGRVEDDVGFASSHNQDGFGLDRIPPEVSCLINPTGSTSQTNINVTLDELDTLSGIAEGDVEVRINSGLWGNTGLPSGGNTINDFTYAASGNGTYEFRYRARDNTINSLGVGDQWSGYVSCGTVIVTAPPPTCTVDLSPSSLNLTQGSTAPLVANPQVTNGTVSRVDFSSSSGVATVNPATDNSSPYSTTVMAGVVGSATLVANVYLNPGNILGCSDTTSVTVTTSGPWVQTQGGDVHGQGDVSSIIPGTIPPISNLFSLDLNSYPGLVSYGGDLASFGQGAVSSKGWLANSPFSAVRSSYSYFYQKLDSPTIDTFSCDMACPIPPVDQTTVYYSADNVTIEDNNPWIIPPNTKVVVLINGDLNISLNQNRRITVPVGSFLAFIIKGNINISGDVGNKEVSTANPHLQGIYLADGVIDTYKDKPEVGEGSGFRFVGAGLFYGKTNVALRRDLKDLCDPICNSNTPSELFVFRPDLVINTPRELLYSKISWLEVAP